MRVSKVLAAIVTPPGSLAVLSAAGLAIGGGPGFALIAIATALTWILATPAAADALAELAEGTTPRGETFAGEDAGAIVVLGRGYSVEKAGRAMLPARALERVYRAAEVHREMQLPVLVTGGDSEGAGSTEAGVMARVLFEDFGVSAKWIEETALDTRENAARAFEILSAEGIERILLVTHALEMTRAVRAFQLAGFEVEGRGVPRALIGRRGAARLLPATSAFEESCVVLYELIARVYYAVR